MRRAVRLEAAGPESGSGSSPRFLPIGGALMIRNPPRLVVSPPLPHDLAHRVWIEIEGVEEGLAREAFQLAAAKLPFETTFVKRTVM